MSSTEVEPPGGQRPRSLRLAAVIGLARDIQADVLFDEIHQIADTPQKGTKTVRKGEGDSSTVETTEADMIEHRRLQIDARKWLIGKMAPKNMATSSRLNTPAPTAARSPWRR